MAYRYNNKPMIKYLLAIDLDHSQYFFGTPYNPRSLRPLEDAVASNNIDMCRFLLECNAPQVLKKESQYTPTALHIAAKNGNIEMVELLLEHGADKNAVFWDYPGSYLWSTLAWWFGDSSYYNKTPIDYALEYNHQDIAQLLGNRDTYSDHEV
jgi:ankyrin repeat protein